MGTCTVNTVFEIVMMQVLVLPGGVSCLLVTPT